MFNEYLNKIKMKKNLKRIIMLSISGMFILNASFAQTTLEWTSESSSSAITGPSTNPVVVTFLKDALNAPANTVFSTYTPTLTATISIRNQQRNSTLTGSSVVLPGITFGTRNTNSTGLPSGVQVAGSYQVYDAFGSNIPALPPTNSMYMTSPTATPAAPTDPTGFGLGKGFDAEAITGGTGSTGGFDSNFGAALYCSVDPLYKAGEAKNGRFYYGDIVVKFNRPVKNPVVHVGGLGGSYNYQPFGTTGDGNRKITYFTTELELANTGMSSTFMAGNPNLNLVGDNILNSSATPNAGSYDDPTSTTNSYPNYGAASGSVRVNGTVQELVYRVYVRGSAASDFNFSKSRLEINGGNPTGSASRDPLNGDFWFLSVSLDKPTQEISGTVFIDANGLTDNDINKTNGVANPTTNVAAQLYANLLRPDGRVVQSQPIGSDGTYLFSDVPLLAGAAQYSVQLTTNFVPGASYTSSQSAPATVLPDGWVNTGEFVSDVTTVGNDGLANGRMVVPFLSSEQAKVQNNFGIQRTPDSENKFRWIKVPTINSIKTLSALSVDSFGLPLPVLAGSDPEDQPALGPLNTKSIKITSLPINDGATTTLLYNGAPVTLNQIIPNYNPDLLQVRFNSVFTPTTQIGGIYQGSTIFTYAYVDIAGAVDPIPATYELRWQPTVPVILEDFTATKSNCVATLNWKTTAEINSDKFEIEMSTLTNPRFVKVGTVPAKGNSTVVSNYQTLFPMESGVVYNFRLKMINVDGSFGYSDIRVVSCIERQEITIKPNPSIDIFKIANMLKGKNVVSVLSSDSKLVQQYEFLTTNADINLASFAKGIYIVKIENENGTIEVKRIVKN
jgi:Secretion system C-terminal sorting domain